MRPVSIRIPPEEVHIEADRRLAFQVLTAFGASSSSRVLAEEGGRLLVEFKTPVKGLFGRRKVYRTVEWVTPREPDLIDFQGVEGPLAILHDRFVLEQDGACTVLRYESEFAVRGWWAGWLLGML